RGEVALRGRRLCDPSPRRDETRDLGTVALVLLRLHQRAFAATEELQTAEVIEDRGNVPAEGLEPLLWQARISFTRIEQGADAAAREAEAGDEVVAALKRPIRDRGCDRMHRGDTRLRDVGQEVDEV